MIPAQGAGAPGGGLRDPGASFQGGAMKRRRRIDPAKAAHSVGGDANWYRSIPTPERTFYCCGRCHTESATVPRPGEPCLKCRLQERSTPPGSSA